MREVNEDSEGETYSTDAGSEGDSEADRKRRRPRRKRRPKPEAIAARVGAYAAAGATDLMLGFTDFPSTRMLEDFALRVRPRLAGLGRSVVTS